jgi:hypothetical protein
MFALRQSLRCLVKMHRHPERAGRPRLAIPGKCR